MAKIILFLISIMLLSSYLTKQAKLSHDNMIDITNIETNTLKGKLTLCNILNYLFIRYTYNTLTINTCDKY